MMVIARLIVVGSIIWLAIIFNSYLTISEKEKEFNIRSEDAHNELDKQFSNATKLLLLGIGIGGFSYFRKNKFNRKDLGKD